MAIVLAHQVNPVCRMGVVASQIVQESVMGTVMDVLDTAKPAVRIVLLDAVGTMLVQHAVILQIVGLAIMPVLFMGVMLKISARHLQGQEQQNRRMEAVVMQMLIVRLRLAIMTHVYSRGVNLLNILVIVNIAFMPRAIQLAGAGSQINAVLLM